MRFSLLSHQKSIKEMKRGVKLSTCCVIALTVMFFLTACGKGFYKDSAGRLVIEPGVSNSDLERAQKLAQNVAEQNRRDQLKRQNKKMKRIQENLIMMKERRSRARSQWRYIDKSGKIVIKPQFDEAGTFVAGLAMVRIGKKYGYINKAGKFVIKPQFYYGGTFSEGLAIVKIMKAGYKKYGYIDKAGKIVIKPQFDSADTFSEGLAKVKIGGRYGYIDKAGKFVIKPQFNSAGHFSEGLAQTMVLRKKANRPPLASKGSKLPR